MRQRYFWSFASKMPEHSTDPTKPLQLKEHRVAQSVGRGIAWSLTVFLLNVQLKYIMLIHKTVVTAQYNNGDLVACPMMDGEYT
jgi:hypothetical protein